MSIDRRAEFVSTHLAIGTNLGDRAENIRRALALLRESGVAITRVSPVVETAAVGGPPGQGAFYNLVVAAQTRHSPPELLSALQSIEHEMGRVRIEKNGPRIIDLDILTYNELVSESKALEIPHPRLHQRLFVLAPWVAIAPDYVVPKHNRTVQELFDSLQEPPPVVVEALQL